MRALAATLALAIATPAMAAPAAKAPVVAKTASGISYQVLRPAQGPRPKATDRVSVNYRGMLANGSTFDASRYDMPITFGLNQVIPGWTEAVQLMEVGSKYRFVIPPELAYGANGAGSDIPPNATLTFDVELIAINPAQ